MFSPDEIDNIKFARAIYGYSPLEVDEFLEHIKRQAEELCRENSTLQRALGDARFDSSKLRLELVHAKDENVRLLNELDVLRCENDSPRTELEKATYEAASVSDAPVIAENTENETEDEGAEIYDASELMSADIRDEAIAADVPYAEDGHNGEDSDSEDAPPSNEENMDIPETDAPDEAGKADVIDITVEHEDSDKTGIAEENVAYINEPDDEYGEDEIPTKAAPDDSEGLSDFDEFFSDFDDDEDDDEDDNDEVIDYSDILGIQKNDSDESEMPGESDGAGEPENVGAAAPVGTGETNIDEIYLDLQKMLDEWDGGNTEPAQEPVKIEEDNVEISDFDSSFRLEKENKDEKEGLGGKHELGSFASEPQDNIETETDTPTAEVTPKGYMRRKYHIKKKRGIKESAGTEEDAAAPNHDTDSNSSNKNGVEPHKNDGDDEDADILAALKSEYDTYNYFFGDGKK